MITITTTFVRSLISIPFFEPAHPAIMSASINVLQSTANVLSHTAELSPNGLTLTLVIDYVDDAHRLAFVAELEAAIPNYFLLRDEYNIDNVITKNDILS